MPNTAKVERGYSEVENIQNPYRVKCPRCEAPVDSKCETKTGWPSGLHSKRWKAVGINTPSFRESEHADKYIKQVDDDKHKKSQVESDNRLREIEQQRKSGFEPWDQWPLGARAMVVNGGVWLRVESGWIRWKGEILPQPTDEISHIEGPAGMVLV